MHIILVSPFLFVQIEYTSIFVLIRRQNLEAEEFKWENLSCSKMTEYIIVDDDVPMELEHMPDMDEFLAAYIENKEEVQEYNYGIGTHAHL